MQQHCFWQGHVLCIWNKFSQQKGKAVCLLKFFVCGRSEFITLLCHILPWEGQCGYEPKSTLLEINSTKINDAFQVNGA